MESALVWVVAAPIGQLAVVHVVLAAPIPLDYADDNQEQQQERYRQHHADEPAGRRHIPVWHLQRSLCW